MRLPLHRRFVKSGYLYLFLIVPIFLFSLQSLPAAAEPSHDIFIPITPVKAKDTSVQKWLDKGVAEDPAKALYDYEINPSMTTAIGVLRHYNYFADKKNDDLRRDLFSDKETARIFQSADAAKYELILKTQQQLDVVDYAYRVGSTGKRYQQWIDWVKKPDRSLDNMPELDPNKQFKSDDDVTNMPKKSALAANVLAGEMINGETAREKFKELTRTLYKTELDPKAMQVEFLSPTEAYSIIRGKRAGEYKPTWPKYVQAWLASDPEKYNGMFGVEQLHRWGMSAGVVCGDVNDPIGSTESYATFHAKHSDRALKDFPDTDLFGWMANNHRQIFQVHGGDLKSLAKYTMRMVEGWQKLGLDIPSDKLGMEVKDLYEMAEMIYKPESDQQVQHVKNIASTAYDLLFNLNKKLLVEGYRKNVKDLMDEIKNNSPPRPASPDEAPDPKTYIDQAANNKRVQELMRNIALGLTNINDELAAEVMKIVEDDIKAGDPEDIKAPSPDWDKVYQGQFSKHIKNLLDDLKSAADSSRSDIEAFKFMRYQVGEQVNAHLTKLAGLNLDDYLTRVAVGDVTETEWRFVNGSMRSVQRQLDPPEVARDLRVLHSMAKNFNWGEEKLALKVKEYFEGNPEGAVTILKHLHNVFHSDTQKKITVRFKDENGDDVVRNIESANWQRVRSAGILAFKGALKGWKIWGDAASGRDLYKAMSEIWLNDSLSKAEIAAAQAKALSSVIDLAEYAELVNWYGASNVKVNIPMGSTLSAAAKLTDGGYMDPQQQKELTFTFIKELTTMYVPQLAIANALYGMATWGYDKYTLSSSQAEIIDLLVENGEWKIEKIDMIGSDGKPVKDKNGNTLQVPDRTKMPELKKVQLMVQGDNGPEVKESAPATVLSEKAGKKTITVKKLAKLLDKEKFPDGIVMKKSGSFVDPRESLMEVAYRSGAGYIASHPTLKVTEDAIRGLISGIFWQTQIFFTSTKDWTKKWVRDNVGVESPVSEDDVDLSKITKENPIKDLKTRAVPVMFFGITVGEVDVKWDSWVQGGIRKNFGYLVSDYWVKRQKILENNVLPALVEEAAKRVMKENMVNQDPSTYLDEIKRLDDRVKEIDRRVWPNIERSADPFKVVAKKDKTYVERDYDPEKDLPIYERFKFETKSSRNEIDRIVKWLITEKSKRKVFTISEMSGADLGGMPMTTQVELTEDEVEDRAGEILKNMIDLAFKFDEAYDKILKDLGTTNSYVGQGDGTPLFSVKPFHARLKPNTGRAKDSGIVKEWGKGYRREYARVEDDVGNILKDRGWGKMNGITGIEEYFGDLTNQGIEFEVAKSHPYWGKLLRLRFQIHKLQLLQQNIKEVTKGEVKRTFSNRMLLEDKVIDVDNPPTGLSIHKQSEGDDPDGGTPSAESVPSNADPGAHLSTMGMRSAFITQMITLMEEEYKALLSMINNMFDMELSIEAVSPATDQRVWTVMKATATLGQKKDKDGNPVKQKFGQVDKDKISKVVKKYSWEVWRKKQSATPGQEWQNDYGKYITKETTVPEVKLPLLEAGTFLLRLYAQGEQNIPLSEAILPFKVEPGKFKGKLKIWGDFPGHALVQIKADAFTADLLDLKMGRDQEIDLDIEVKKAQRLNKQDFNDLDNKFYVDFGAWAWVNVPPKAESEKEPGKMYPGELRVDPEDVIELFYPYNVDVSAKVIDASGVKPKKEVEYFITNGTQQLLFEQGYLKLKKGDVVSGRVKYNHPPIKLEEKIKDVIFDPANGFVIESEVKLPFFEEGNLRVLGEFTPPANMQPAAVLESGQMRPSLADDMPVGNGGQFDFINSKSVYLKDKLTVTAMLYDTEKRMYRPTGGKFEQQLVEGKELRCTIPLEPHEVTIKPIEVKVVDAAGKEVPEDNVKVLVGTNSASWDGNVFSSEWTFKKKDETVDIKATYKMSGGSTVSGTHQLSINDFDILGTPKPPPVITIALPFYMTLQINGSTVVNVPQGKQKPQDVRISNSSLGIDILNNADAPFSVTTQKEVLVGVSIVLDAVAQATQSEGKYKGSSKAKTVTAGLKAFDAGVITLEQDKSSIGFVSINNLSLVLGTGGKPVHGQPLPVSASITVNDYEGPLAINWKRFSDNASDIQVKGSVAKGEKFTADYTFPPVPKASRVTDDTVEIVISDGADQKVGKTHNFSWREGDEFLGLRFASAKDNKPSSRFSVGAKINVSSSWKIVDDAGSIRTIIYKADGNEFARMDVPVTKGGRLQHTASLDTKGLTEGKIDIQVELVNIDPEMKAAGNGPLHLKEAKDSIISAGAAIAAGSTSKGKRFSQGDKVHVNALIGAAESKDGMRILHLEYRGRMVLSENFDMKGDETVSKAFLINTGKLDAGTHTFYVTLFDAEGERQDRKIVRIRLAEKQTPAGGNQGGLQNVSCTGDTVSIKVWDHGAQDGDIVTLTIGGNTILDGFNMGDSGDKIHGCGGSEPNTPPCAFMNLPFPSGSRVPITITAHNEGSASPNTASLKVSGGCTPELQHWGLSTGESASIFITKSQPQPTGQQQSGQPGTQGAGSKKPSTPIQSWP